MEYIHARTYVQRPCHPPKKRRVFAYIHNTLIYMYIYANMHSVSYIYIHTYIYTYIHICIYIYIYIYMRVCIHSAPHPPWTPRVSLWRSPTDVWKG